METNQDKVKALIGIENYRKLASAGYIAIEIKTLEILLAHNVQLQKLEDGIRELERINNIDVVEPKTSPAPAQMPDIDIDYEMTALPKFIPADYDWSTDMAFQTLEDEVKSFNTFGIPLYIRPSSARGSDGKQEGELSVVFLAKGNSKFIDSLKEHQWTIHRWRVKDKNYPTRNVTQIQAKKHVKLRYKMGYEAKLVDIQ